jgi:hypothetical protein
MVQLRPFYYLEKMHPDGRKLDTGSGEKFEPISTNPYLSIINQLFNEINWLFLEF